MIYLAVPPESVRRAYDQFIGLLSRGLNTLCVKKRDNHVVIEFGLTDFTRLILMKYEMLQRDTRSLL